MKKGLLFRSVIIICCTLTLIFCATARAGEKNKSLTENDLNGIRKIANGLQMCSLTRRTIYSGSERGIR